MSVVDGVGVTASVIKVNGVTVYRGIYVHGRLISDLSPTYPDGAAVLQALRTLHDWLRISPICHSDIQADNRSTGNYTAVCAIQLWLRDGVLGPASTIASEIIDYLGAIQNRSECDLSLNALFPAEGSQTIEELP